VKVDPNDQAKIAIVWDRVAKGPARGEVRPVGGEGLLPATVLSGAANEDSVEALEGLAKLRDSGALTHAEFEQQKAKILGS
jgi:hypothetical protein